MSKTSATRSVGRPKSAQKRKQILQGAADLLLAKGYSHTSMEAVAKASGVSKQTVYSHFTSKESLYRAIIESKCEEYQIENASVCVDSQALEEILRGIGYNFIQLLQDENVIAMYKVVIGESSKNSEVAQLFYEAGLQHSCRIVATLFTLHPSSQLSPDCALEAAHDFFNLLKSDFHMLSMLGLSYTLSESEQLALSKKVAKKTLAIMPLIAKD